MACKNRNSLLLFNHCTAQITNAVNWSTFKFCTCHKSHVTSGSIYCINCAYWKHLVLYYLHDIGKHVLQIRKWNISDTVRSVSVSWTSISNTVVHNFFPKGKGQLDGLPKWIPRFYRLFSIYDHEKNCGHPLFWMWNKWLRRGKGVR